MSLMEWPKNIETFKKQKISYLKITKLNFIKDWKSIRILFKLAFNFYFEKRIKL